MALIAPPVFLDGDDDVLRAQVRNILRQHNFFFCDDIDVAGEALLAVPRRPAAILAGLGCVNLVAHAVAASSEDHNDQRAEETVADNDNFWSSTGSQHEGSDECLLFRLRAPLCVVRAVQVSVYRATFQHGAPVYPPVTVSIDVGHSPSTLRCVAPPAVCACSHEQQTFLLPPGASSAAVGSFVAVRLHGKRQQQVDDRIFYVALRHVRVLGHDLSPLHANAALCATALPSATASPLPPHGLPGLLHAQLHGVTGALTALQAIRTAPCGPAAAPAAASAQRVPVHPATAPAPGSGACGGDGGPAQRARDHPFTAAAIEACLSRAAVVGQGAPAGGDREAWRRGGGEGRGAGEAGGRREAGPPARWVGALAWLHEGPASSRGRGEGRYALRGSVRAHRAVVSAVVEAAAARGGAGARWPPHDAEAFAAPAHRARLEPPSEGLFVWSEAPRGVSRTGGREGSDGGAAPMSVDGAEASVGPPPSSGGSCVPAAQAGRDGGAGVGVGAPLLGPARRALDTRRIAVRDPTADRPGDRWSSRLQPEPDRRPLAVSDLFGSAVSVPVVI